MLTLKQVKILKAANEGIVKVEKENLLQATILATNNFLTRRKGDRFSITPQGIHLCRVFELNEANGDADCKDDESIVLFKGKKCTFTS